MQKSFHISKRYAHIISFLDTKENLSEYLCDLVEMDYRNRINTLDTIEVVELVFNRMEESLHTKFIELIRTELKDVQILVDSMKSNKTE